MEVWRHLFDQVFIELLQCIMTSDTLLCVCLSWYSVLRMWWAPETPFWILTLCKLEHGATVYLCDQKQLSYSYDLNENNLDGVQLNLNTFKASVLKGGKGTSLRSCRLIPLHVLSPKQLTAKWWSRKISYKHFTAVFVRFRIGVLCKIFLNILKFLYLTFFVNRK